MTSKPGEPDYVSPGLGSNAAADAGAFLEKQAAAVKQAETAPSAEPAEKKEDTVAESEKKDEPSVAPPEQKAEEPVTEAAPSVTAPSATAAVAAAPLPAAPGPAPASSSSEPSWPETPAEHPLAKFFDSITELTTEADYNEVYGLTLSTTTPFHTKLILQKFLRANANDLPKAKAQLLETLKWRKTFQPAKAVEETFDNERFAGLGYILTLDDVPESANKTDVVTFNVYGAVKDNKKTFGDLEGFLRWRVALMERSIQKLNLAAATTPIPDFGQGPDPYQGIQIHDYLQVSFLRQHPDVKAATSKTIETLGRYYPETLSRKFFVNVPVIMGWVFALRKLVVAPETARKFTVLSYGDQLATELGPSIPKVYGGTAGDLKEIGEALKAKDVEVEATE
ncbi:CRAL/TRIO domain-containing protein [Melanomma pulvis-pyrius CBS 109.77]|uniref:Phosphatidylinositol transfer protein SFH5 n=1 Tax=Melanomma pulvis-pyrius CBS 109.77 TaxID=1314802 RepID=A0A6A6WS97_9PLEO|nr:CRAL/TRIO domain-containing protein [Melanomma pulvis-pyrius CBS 109.77]